MIVNDDSTIVNKLETSLIDDARVVNYDRHMFIAQATELSYWYKEKTCVQNKSKFITEESLVTQ
jgi:hypothetical protein